MKNRIIVWLLAINAILLAGLLGILSYKFLFKKLSQNYENTQASISEQHSKMPVTKVTFYEKEWDFGEVEQNSHNEKIFSFKNEGPHPYLIEDARGSCGCTVPEYPKDPIPPGQEGKIKVVYSPGMQQGHQTKIVTITGNTDPPNIILTIKAFVKPSSGSASK